MNSSVKQAQKCQKISAIFTKKDCTNKKEYYINIKKMRIQELESICKKCPKNARLKNES